MAIGTPHSPQLLLYCIEQGMSHTTTTTSSVQSTRQSSVTQSVPARRSVPFSWPDNSFISFRGQLPSSADVLLLLSPSTFDFRVFTKAHNFTWPSQSQGELIKLTISGKSSQIINYRVSRASEEEQ